MVNLKRVFLSLLGLGVLISCGTETVTYTLDVTPSPPEGGTVTPTNEVYQEGEEIQLLATPSEGWRFVDWDGDWSISDNPTSVIMNKNYTIKGNFTKRDYPLNIEIIGEGTVEEEIISQKTTDYPYGTVVRLTPIPNQDWVFDGWSGDISDENDVIELTIDKETNITVTFLMKNPFKTLEITKWWSDYKSAYTVTYDMGFPLLNDFENKWLIESGLYIDYEIVSSSYNIRPSRVDYLKSLHIQNFGYFGHGHEHIDHDKVSYEEAYNSFKSNYEGIESYGLQPISYAYPYGAGRRDSTRIALRESGFLSGRLNQEVFEGYGPYIMEYTESSPKDWYGLPALRMEDLDYQNCDYCINSPQELIPYIYENVERQSWLITTYHAIGFDGKTDDRPIGWGFYKRDNFFQEMETVKSLMEKKHLWLASMNDVTLYTYLRNNTTFDLLKETNNSYKLVFNTNLNKKDFNMDITLKMLVELNMDYNSIKISDSYNLTVFESDVLTDTLIVNLNPHLGPYSILFK
jgi:hypothetical protein